MLPAMPLLALLYASPPPPFSCIPLGRPKCFARGGQPRNGLRGLACGAQAGPGAAPWSEVRISEGASGAGLGEEDPGETLRRGETVVLLPGIASPEACAALVETCLRVTEAERGGGGDEKPALVRLILDELPPDARAGCDAILAGVCGRLDASLPSVSAAHFPEQERPLGELLAAGELEYAWREPAVIVYSEGSDGYAQTPHVDGQALTMLVPLSDPEADFTGGGTGFWPVSEPHPEAVPAPTVLRPPPGTALVFGGRFAKHCGLPVDGGIRVVFVCSFGVAPPLTPERLAQIKFRGG